MSDTPTADLLDTDDLYRLTAEVANGVPVSKSVLPDTPAVRKARATLVREIAEIRARGHEVDVPHEIQAPTAAEVTSGTSGRPARH